MSDWHTIQDSFLAGEVSPRYVATSDPEIREGALSIAQNGIILMQGNITTRMGTNFLIDTGADGTDIVRVWPFYNIRNEQVVSMWTSGKVTVKDVGLKRSLDMPDKAQVNEYDQILDNPYFIYGLTGWFNSGIYTDDNIFYRVSSAAGDLAQFQVQFTDYQSASIDDISIRQRVAVDSIDSFVVSLKGLKVFSNGDPDVDIQVRFRMGLTEGGSQIVERDYDIEEDMTTLTENINIPGGVSGNIWIQAQIHLTGITNKNISGQQIYRIFLSEFMVYAYTGEVIIPIDLVTPYIERQLEHLHFLQSPFDEQELLVFHPAHPVHALYFIGGAYVFEEYEFPEPEEGNRAPPWGPNNYPSVATAYQGRLVLTGASNDPEAHWASRNGDWKDFAIGEIGSENVPVPDDPVWFTPTERGINTWLSGFKRLLFGNTQHEYSVDSQSGLLQPADVGVYQQGSYGSLRIPQKFTIGNSVVLATGGNTSLRMVKYNRDDDGYIAPDRLIKAEHLGRKIIRHHFYTKDPHEILWCIMADGSISIMSFDEELEVYAWSHFVTDGRFIDGCVVVDEFGRDNVVLIVERIIQGVTKKYLETIGDLRNIQNWHHLDSHMRVFNTGGGQIIGGLQHLEGKTVSFFTDDKYSGEQVVNNGTIVVFDPAAHVDVGIQFLFTAGTITEDSISPAFGITAKKRFSKVGVRGIFSNPPMINLQRPPDRAPQARMDIPQPPEAMLDADVTEMRWDGHGIIWVQEIAPLRLTIAGIYGKLSTNEV